MQENTYLIVQMQAPLDFLKLKNEFNINVNVKEGVLLVKQMLLN